MQIDFREIIFSLRENKKPFLAIETVFLFFTEINFDA
jgi:hypothetical protein